MNYLPAKRIFYLNKYVINKHLSNLNKYEVFDEFFIASSEMSEAMNDLDEIIKCGFNLSKDKISCNKKEYSIYGYVIGKGMNEDSIKKIEDSDFYNL
ncbi:MAG TPA: hypothetical protein VNX01_15665 [Bacteroidia bacterium]|jgi:hypothetical protein|nr:hypothetical protein [Bacteroidia bacterium]